MIITEKLTKIYRTYRKEPGLWGAVKGLGVRKYDETRAADGKSGRIPIRACLHQGGVLFLTAD
jgi:ABC-2 type transport system ATP-binding protein